jgi:hypothetical protein
MAIEDSQTFIFQPLETTMWFISHDYRDGLFLLTTTQLHTEMMSSLSLQVWGEQNGEKNN